MSAQFSQRDAEEKIKSIRFPTYVAHVVRENGTSLEELGRLMSEPRGFLSQALKRTRISLPLLITLSVHLRVNLLEPFLNLLPDPTRANPPRSCAAGRDRPPGGRTGSNDQRAGYL